MRAIAALAGLLALASAGTASAATRRHSAPACPPRHARVVLRDTQALVSSRPSKQGAGRDFLGCLRHGRPRTRRLAYGESPSDPYSETFALRWTLARTVVAWWGAVVPSQSCRYGAPCPAPTGVVHVVDLRTGKEHIAHSYPVAKVVVNAGGIVAWLQGGAGRYALEAAGWNGPRTILDMGSIDPASVRIDATTIHWTDAGAAKSAPAP